MWKKKSMKSGFGCNEQSYAMRNFFSVFLWPKNTYWPKLCNQINLLLSEISICRVMTVKKLFRLISLVFLYFPYLDHLGAQIVEIVRK